VADEDSKDSGWNWVIGFFAAGPVFMLLLIVASWLVSKIT